MDINDNTLHKASHSLPAPLLGLLWGNHQLFYWLSPTTNTVALHTLRIWLPKSWNYFYKNDKLFLSLNTTIHFLYYKRQELTKRWICGTRKLVVVMTTWTETPSVTLIQKVWSIVLSGINTCIAAAADCWGMLPGGATIHDCPHSLGSQLDLP